MGYRYGEEDFPPYGERRPICPISDASKGRKTSSDKAISGLCMKRTASGRVLEVIAVSTDAVAPAFYTGQPLNELCYRGVRVDGEGFQPVLRK